MLGNYDEASDALSEQLALYRELSPRPNAGASVLHEQLIKPMRDTDPKTWDAAARAGAGMSDHDALDIALRALEDSA
jgi:hypothetical protein